MSSYIPVALRREVNERANGCCEYCRMSESAGSVNFVIDHIIAEKHGGETTSSNLCLSCYRCNSYKGSDISSVDWSSGDVVPLFNPRQQEWEVHFEQDEAWIRPLTSIGRVTVSLLQLNSPERREERELLLALGEFPCA